jgi:hypothetical protein
MVAYVMGLKASVSILGRDVVTFPCTHNPGSPLRVLSDANICGLNMKVTFFINSLG